MLVHLKRGPCCFQVQGGGVAGFAEWGEVFGASACWNCVGNVDQGLRGLSDGDIGDYLIRQRIDGTACSPFSKAT